MNSAINSSVNEAPTDKTSIFWDAVEREETQKKTFGKWVQFQLSRHPSPVRKEAVTDLYYDLRDGHVLLDLLEVIVKPHFDSNSVNSRINEQDTKLGNKFVGITQNDLWKREQGNLRVHHLANAGTVLNILRDNQHPFSKCVNINSVDIVDGKNKLVHISYTKFSVNVVIIILVF